MAPVNIRPFAEVAAEAEVEAQQRRARSQSISSRGDLDIPGTGLVETQRSIGSFGRQKQEEEDDNKEDEDMDEEDQASEAGLGRDPYGWSQRKRGTPKKYGK